MPFKSYKSESRVDWGTNIPNDQQITAEKIQLGAILRIADAVELMTKRYQDLIDSRNWFQRRTEMAENELKTERKKNAALRGYIRKLKEKEAEKKEK